MAHSPAWLTPLPANRFSNKLAPNVPNNMLFFEVFLFFFKSFIQIDILTQVIRITQYMQINNETQ